MPRALGRLRLRSRGSTGYCVNYRHLKHGALLRAIAPSGHAITRELMPIADLHSAIRKYLSARAHFLTFRSYV